MEPHVALVALAEIGARVLGPLVGFGQEHPALVMLVEIGADRLQHVMRFGQVLVVGPVAFDQIGDCIEPQPVHALVEPEVHRIQHRIHHGGVVEVQIRLVVEEAVPVELLGHRIPGPVAVMGVVEDDPGLVHPLLRIVGPDIPVPLGRALRRAAGALEPLVLIAGVVDDKLGDDLQTTPVRFGDEALEVLHRAVGRIDRLVLGDVIAVVPERRRVEGQQPDGRRAQLLNVIQPAHQTGEVADAVAIGVLERLDVKLVDDRVLVPVRRCCSCLVRGDDGVLAGHAAPPGGRSFQTA